MRKYILFFSLLFLVACSEQISGQHRNYLMNEDWIVKEKLEETKYELNMPEEILVNYDASGVTFFRDYQNQEVTKYIYLLKEKDIEGANIKAVIFENDGKIIGGYGVLSSWTPGVFNLEEKERLIAENKINQ